MEKALKKIVRDLKISKNTVRKYLRQEGPPTYKKGKRRTSQWIKKSGQ